MNCNVWTAIIVFSCLLSGSNALRLAPRPSFFQNTCLSKFESETAQVWKNLPVSASSFSERVRSCKVANNLEHHEIHDKGKSSLFSNQSTSKRLYADGCSLKNPLEHPELKRKIKEILDGKSIIFLGDSMHFVGSLCCTLSELDVDVKECRLEDFRTYPNSTKQVQRTLAKIAHADVAIVFPAMRYQLHNEGADMREGMQRFLREVFALRESKSAAIPDRLMFEEPLAQHFLNGPFRSNEDMENSKCDVDGQPSATDNHCCALNDSNPNNFRVKALNSAIAEHEKDLQAAVLDNFGTRGKVSVLHTYGSSVGAFADHKWNNEFRSYDCTHYFLNSPIMEHRANFFLAKYVEVTDPDFASNFNLCDC